MKSVKGLAAIVILALLVSLPSTSYGEGAAEGGAEGAASVSLMSSYVWRGQEIHNDTAIQPTIEVGASGYSVNLWADYNVDTSEVVETDFTFDFSNSVDKIGYSVGYIFYAFDGAPDTQEIYGTVSYDTLLSPSVGLYWDYDETDSLFINLAVGHDFAVGAYTVTAGASLGYYSYNNAENDWQNFELSLSTAIPVGPFSVDPSVAYSVDLYDGTGKTNAGAIAPADDELYGGVTLAYSF
ncbi:MAG: TorF family putative porin [Thermodesulfobacteriota bacterium]